MITINNREYQTKVFGDQEWMIEDLGKCPFEEDVAGSSLLYDHRYYYNWEAATHLIGIPKGWRLPTKEDFIRLNACVGLKGILGDWRGVLGSSGNGTSVHYAGSYGYYWSSTYYSTTLAYYLYFHSGNVYPQYYMGKYHGCAVRLVRDYKVPSTCPCQGCPCVYKRSCNN